MKAAPSNTSKLEVKTSCQDTVFSSSLILWLFLFFDTHQDTAVHEWVTSQLSSWKLLGYLLSTAAEILIFFLKFRWMKKCEWSYCECSNYNFHRFFFLGLVGVCGYQNSWVWLGWQLSLAFNKELVRHILLFHIGETKRQN